MSLRKKGRPKTKNHAQDGGTLRATRHQHPAILPWFLVLGWRPSFRVSHGHLARLAQRAGLLLDLRFRARMLRALAHDPFQKPSWLSNDHAKTRAKRRAYFTTSSTANVVLFEQRLVARLVLALQVVEKRTPCGDHFQQAA